MREVIVKSGSGTLSQNIQVGPHHLLADEPTELGGEDQGPAPHEWLLAGLGACTSMTLKLYAERKKWPLTSVEVRLTGQKQDKGYQIQRVISLHGPLDEDQRARLLDIANKCPVHRTLSGDIQIESVLR